MQVVLELLVVLVPWVLLEQPCFSLTYFSFVKFLVIFTTMCRHRKIS